VTVRGSKRGRHPPSERGRRLAKALWFSLVGPVLVAVISTVSIALWERLTDEERALTHTEIRLFAARDPRRFIVASNDHGTCTAESNVDPGVPEAHRCFGRTKRNYEGQPVQFLYDPCWDIRVYIGEGRERLMCVANPWTRNATMFTVKGWTRFSEKPPRVRTTAERPPYKPRSLRKAPPWALELDNGQSCVFVSGATEVMAGMRWNYFCGKGADFKPDRPGGGWVIGFPERTRAVWRVSFLAHQDVQAVPVAVRVAWY
jgi:hypothetical protein